MGILEDSLQEIAENLDKRRLEITNIRRLILNYKGKPLETTIVSMGIALLYANWEGYVREICQLYLEYIEKAGYCTRELNADMLGYLWTTALKPLTGGLNIDKKRAIAELALNSMGDTVHFSDNERNINVKSNLSFDVLSDLATQLCINDSSLVPYKHHLNSMVNLRNNIAHGSTPRSLTYKDFEQHANCLINLMEKFETMVFRAAEKSTFCA